MSRPTAVLICPGRGTYNKTELGTLTRTHGNRGKTSGKLRFAGHVVVASN